MSQLDLSADVIALATAMVDTPSVSGSEGRLADAVEAALRTVDHLDVERDGNVVLARTDFGRDRRVVLAGHLDTVPAAGNLPSRREGDLLYGCGTTDMKGGLAVMLRLAATVTEPVHDLTFAFYDCEEVEAIRNGLGRLARSRPDAIRGDFAILLEPSNGVVEAGCQGTLRIEVHTTGKRAHTARSWLGVNAIHAAGEVLRRLQEYEPRRVDVEGCEYREGLSAVRISGGVVGNVVPDACTVTVNYRYAPDLDETQAVKHMAEVFDGFDVDIIDSAPPAPPGLSNPAVAEFVAATGAPPVAKYGWTDVARFAAIGVPAVNFGPGDPNLAHTLDEHVDVNQIVDCERILRAWLTGGR